MANSLHEREAEIVGRPEERARIERLLETGGRLVLVGDAGIGKTTLWRDGVESARVRGSRVLVAAPAEAEQAFSFAVLGDLLRPTFDEIADVLPQPQRRALERALLRAEGEVDVHTAGVAAHTALGSLAQTSPVVVAVDDVQWVDAESAAVLEFVLRRLDSLTCLLALRRGTTTSLRVEADEIDVGGLTVGAFHHLLVTRLGVALPRPALLRAHELSGGNPFYGLELARARTEDGHLALPASIQDLLAERLRALPPETQRALAELALAGTPQPGADLTPAVDADVVVTASGETRFVHPLLAETAVEMLDADARRSLHREIAERTTDAERRARHLAKAATGPDDEVSSIVADAARTAARSRASAAELWELAASLTPPEEDRLIAERLIEAGIAHVLSGNPYYGVGLVQANVDSLPAGTIRSRALAHLAFLHGRQDVRLIIPGLEAAVAEIDDVHARPELVDMLCGTVVATGDALRSAAIADAYLEQAEACGDDSVLAQALARSALSRLSCDRPAWELIERAQALEPSATRVPLIFALIRDGRYDDARSLLEQALANPYIHIYGYHSLVANLASLELTAGRWQAAEAYTEEMLAVGEQIDAPYMVGAGFGGSATLDALRGRSEAAREKAVRAIEIEERIHATMHADIARFALGLLELGLGRSEAAADAYRNVGPQGWTRLCIWVGARPAADAVEAFAAVGDLPAAREIAESLPEDARERPVTAASIASAEGDVDRAIELVRSAEPAPAPFRRAREQLLLGRLLRQGRRRGEAREALTAAREEFARLGSPPWIERADEELARLGGRSPAGATLTFSEQRVAELVAEGLSNKEVAVRLVVTVRTVEAHLSKIYAKLGLRSRTELAAAWKQRHSTQ